MPSIKNETLLVNVENSIQVFLGRQKNVLCSCFRFLRKISDQTLDPQFLEEAEEEMTMNRLHKMVTFGVSRF